MILRQMDEFERLGGSFAVETTLASRSLATRAESLQRQGYAFYLIYLWTPNPEFSISRVAARVRAGGHDIPEETIRRRHRASLRNFFELYQPIADAWQVFDNTELDLLIRPIAQGRRNQSLQIHDLTFWTFLKQSYANA